MNNLKKYLKKYLRNNGKKIRCKNNWSEKEKSKKDKKILNKKKEKKKKEKKERMEIWQLKKPKNLELNLGMYHLNLTTKIKI